MPTAPHTRLAHYEIIAPLGAGCVGEVYLAEDTRLDRQVALKLLPAELTQDPERVRRFMQEAKAASALNHPNIITVYDLGESEAGRFIVMELVAGRSLRAVIAEDNSIETVLKLGAQMAKALSAAHAAGITHRDIKPDKIMVRDDGYVKILDFGLARLAPAGSGEEETTLGRPGQTDKLMDLVRYMSPEQARGLSAGHESDVFSLGLIFYELAAGRHPFAAAASRGLRALLDAIIADAPAPPTQLNPRLSGELERLILRMLDKDAPQRPLAAEVEAALIEIGERARAAAGPAKNTDESDPLPADEREASEVLHLAHVLFCDIVGYTLLPIDRQTEVMRTLQEVVRQTDAYRRAETAGNLVRLPAGDGMALAFLQDPSAPVRCAFEIARTLKAFPGIHLRMGVHSGPVFRSTDINVNRNVVGEGINMAQRVMNCGDAGHILVSRQVAKVLRLVSRWEPYVHDLGVHEVKHGMRVHLYNLHGNELGNPDVPSKLRGIPNAPSAELSSDSESLMEQETPPAPALKVATQPLRPSAAPVVQQAEAVVTPAPVPVLPQRPSRARLLALPAILLFVVAGILGWDAMRSKPAASIAERELTYSLFIQRMRDGQPFREPFEATGREIFEDGWKFRFQFSSPQPGFIYLLNERPVAEGAISYQFLFPTPNIQDGSARLTANQPLQTGWYLIGQTPGVERIFLVWSNEAVPELESVKGVVNPVEKGGIADPVQLNAVRQLLSRYAQSKPEIEPGRIHKQSTLRGRDGTLIHTVELEHP